MSTTATFTARSASYFAERGWTSPLPHELDSDRTLVLAFGWAGLDPGSGVVRDLRAAFPSSHLLGCSTAGEIHGTRLHDDSVSLVACRFSHTRLASMSAPVRKPEDSRSAGRVIAEQLDRPELRAVFVLSDGLKVNGSALVQGLTSALPAGVVITGGLAADGSRFGRTWVLRNGQPEEGFVTAVGLYGSRVRVGHGSKGGWDVFGPERVVTRSRNNVLFELDGKPALPLYKKYLGERASELPASALLFPLSLRRTKADPDAFVRTILAVDESAQSMTFAGDIPEGHLAQLMRANFDRLIEGAAESAVMTRETASAAGPCLAVAVSCVGRRLVLGERTEEELERAAEILPRDSIQAGFYSYGEISPFASGSCDLHNQTMTLTTLTEA
ncbi:MAG TPA: FIST N-terminal domain-containing protein [Phycisphaerales bacterium]|nr:FIST N-terminal domain-containing protein [Phycisphaerales bacterium]